MRKLFWAILIVAILALAVGGYAKFAQGQNPPERPTPTPVPPPPPFPSPESLSSEQRAIRYYFVDKAQLSGFGMILPRELTSQEKEKVIQIALKIEPVLERTSQGYTYRAELAWVSYDTRGPDIDNRWGYENYSIKDRAQANPAITWFPAAKIGLGTPQQFVISVAVDLGMDKAVYAIRRPDVHVSAPQYLRYLTEEEKAKVIAIASETQAVKTYAGGNDATSFQWVALSPGGTAFSLDYNTVEIGVPAYQDTILKSKSMVIYPAVLFDSGSWAISIAVDLKSEKVVYEFRHPVR